MQIAFQIFPVIALILLGWLLRSRGFAGEGFWAGAERMTYYVFFPMLLFRSASSIDFSEIPWSLVWVVVLAISMLAVVAVLMARKLTRAPGTRSGIFQSSIRTNVYIPMGVAAASLGELGAGLMALTVAVGVPLVNLYSVLVATRWTDRAPDDRSHPFIELMTNPLILACIAGLGFNAMTWELPIAIGGVVSALSNAALPLGLLTVGGGLVRGLSESASLHVLIMPTLLKQGLMPLLTVTLALAFGLEGAAFAVLLMYSFIPVSPSSYVFAVNTQGDAPLVASLITLQTIIAMLIMPFVVAALV